MTFGIAFTIFVQPVHVDLVFRLLDSEPGELSLNLGVCPG
jgi:hypothetical protein